MLVLSRRQGERICITDTLSGERIDITAVLTKADKVRLAFQASDRFEIHREEVQHAVDLERSANA